ncbi:MAG: F0F1 ATP synthase subunit gamma [Acidimicrobiales bacterium]
MAGGQERVLRRRIRSIQSTKKITRAMELIAASRIVKAQQAILAARPYVEKMAEVVADLARTPDAAGSPLFGGHGDSDGPGGTAVIAVTADRGLAGAYNSSVLRGVERLVAERRRRGGDVMLVTSGRKAESFFRFRGEEVARSVTGVSERPTFEAARQMVETVMGAIRAGEVGEVQLVFTRFLSMGSQAVTTRRLVPLDVTPPDGAADGPAPAEHRFVDYEYEPDPAAILDLLLPRWLEAEVYAALLEGAASEQAARQRAMKAATDNADDLATTLTRVMNRARQDTITTEIMEIVGGAEALRGGSPEGGSWKELYLPPDDARAATGP